MNTNKMAGFTIVEVILVLAVTGLMMVGILAGSAAQVRQQEYRDSVHALQAEMQRQYTAVKNPTIDRAKSASTSTCGITNPVSRGAAVNCFVVGRLISYENSGELTETPILGRAPGGDSSQSINNAAGETGSDATANGWTLYIDDDAASDYTIEWGSKIKATSTDIMATDTFNILLIMSPSDGSIRTYANREHAIVDPSQLYDLLASSQKTLNLCVVAGSGVIFGDPLAVQVPADTSGVTGVTIPAQDEGLCHGV